MIAGAAPDPAGSTVAASPRSLAVPGQWLVAALLALFALDNVLVLHFFGLPPWATVALAAVVGTGIVACIVRPAAPTFRVPLTTLIAALAFALAFFLLGGEGRLFYATPDWQIRDAVLADLASHDWPFAYSLHGVVYVLRAPLGMYLFPALAGGGSAHDVALLFSNSVRLGLILAIGSTLYAEPLKRVLALGILALFSGWDALGLAVSTQGAPQTWDHIENWNFGFQYSSTVTLAFWAPNHALAGWTCALMFFLWRRGDIPVGIFAAAIPLVAIWSPLAIMGAIPFALWAGITVLRGRAFDRRDLALASLALAVALPSLLYERLDAARVGAGPRYPSLDIYFGVLVFEVLPFILLPLRARAISATDRQTLWIVLACLLLMPLWQIGIGADFQMRASIMPLTLLALAFADWVIRAVNTRPMPKGDVLYALLALAIGAVTPALEVRRALAHGPSPEPRCSLIGVWDKQTGLIAPRASYLARRSALPGWIGVVPVKAGGKDPDHCWDHPWVPVSN